MLEITSEVKLLIILTHKRRSDDLGGLATALGERC